jgi:hypothetical protein
MGLSLVPVLVLVVRVAAACRAAAWVRAVRLARARTLACCASRCAARVAALAAQSSARRMASSTSIRFPVPVLDSIAEIKMSAITRTASPTAGFPGAA